MYTCTSICVYLWTTWCVLVTWECFCSPGRLPYVIPLFCLTCVRDGLTRLLHGAVVYTRSMFSIELCVKELSYDTYPGVLTSLCMPGANLSLMYMPMLFDVMCKSLFVTHITHTKGSSRKCQFLVYVSVFMSLYTVCVCVCVHCCMVLVWSHILIQVQGAPPPWPNLSYDFRISCVWAHFHSFLC